MKHRKTFTPPVETKRDRSKKAISGTPGLYVVHDYQ